MKTHTTNHRKGQFRRVLVEQLETRMLLAIGPMPTYPVAPVDAAVAAYYSSAGGTNTMSQSATVSSPATPAFNLAQTLSDQAQLTTLAFDGLAMMTGNLDAQSFFPPGKVADYFGFQYLRDNDPDNMGHNTSFLTRVANNVIYILNDSQLAKLATLATAQATQVNLYGYERFALMEAFRRVLDGDIPSGSSGLNLDAVKSASRQLYLLDGQISFDRASLYASIINSLDSTQKAYLDAMKGKGFNSWPDITNDQIKSKMQKLPQGTAQDVMTYASDIFSWYAGSLDADVYFCPERHGTYYGGFYIKDAPAVGHEGYSISEQLTATAGAALCDSSKGYVTQAQATMMSSLLDLQRNNLYAGTTNIVQTRTQIATLLRSLLTPTASSDSVKAQVLALSGTYGDLDGTDNYNYANVFAEVYKTLTADQKTNLAALRKSLMSGTYSDGTPFDYSVCTTPFLYSIAVTDMSLIAPYINNTDYLFFEPSVAPIALSSTTVSENQPAGTIVGAFSMTAPGASNTFTYSLVSGTGSTNNASFQIVGNVLKTRAAFNYEVKNSYSIRVRSTDQGGLRTEQVFVINVSNVNEAPVVAAKTFALPENSPNGTVVGTVTATDPDIGQTIAWAITGGNTGNAFAIDPASGQITVANTAVLDYETMKTFTLKLQATDNGVPALAGTGTVTIKLTNVNERPTNISLSSTSIAENKPAGSVVGILIATDPDANQTFTYSLVSGIGGNDNGSFSIVGKTLRTKTPFDYEVKKSYSILVRVTDQGGLTFDNQFTISVTNVNEAPMVTGFARTEVRNTSFTFSAADFTAAFSDPDGDALAKIRIVAVPTKGTLKLNGVTVTAGREIPVSQLGTLVYTPPTNYAGSASFTWNGSDGLLYALSKSTVTLTVL